MKLALCCVALCGFAAPAGAQFKLQQAFEGATATGWTLSDSAFLTAPSIDAAGSGWLRLTNVATDEQGLALNNAFTFASNQSVTVEFNYVAWGGTGADGMTLFLYDPTTSSPMSGAVYGGGLGYCGGAGGYLAIGLDEYGNFSNPADRCLTASGGPGRKPESLVIRGPKSATNAWVTTTSVPGGIDNPGVATRPAAKTVLMTITPAVSPAVGYTITVQFQSASGQPFQTLLSNVSFPYAPPANLSVGFSGGTGGSTNNHELHGLVTASPDDLQVTMNGPSQVLQGAPVTYTVTVANNGSYPIDSADAPTVLDTLPAALTGATWTCVGSGGATCEPSGSGSLNSANLTLPSNGLVTYTITGTLDPTSTCGSTLSNSANADFGNTSTFLDPDETNNTASVASTVTCNMTLVPSPTALAFGPQTVAVASTSQTVTLTEGINSATLSSIAVTGDYSQTNDCPASLSAAQTCTINVVFTPTTEGSRNGTLTILSNAIASPTVTTAVNLSGTGTNAVPSAFSFTALNNVDLSSVQVSNAIAVANTNVPSPISVSSGAQYSINGGAFTSVAGVVSPGAQVQVQVTAASNYSTTVSAILTIGGVASPFAVTTGTQPVLQGGFTALTGTSVSSVQISNPITVSGTTIPAPITVSSGAEYSVNGGPFTTAAGVVQPGDQVRIEVTTPSAYNATSSAAVTIGGVNSTFTVTTAAQPVLQGDFTPVTSTTPSSVQISNPITVTGTTAPASISITSGAEYSIDGGPFTSSPGLVSPGDQVRVQMTAPTAYNTTASAELNIGGVLSKFTISTGAQPVLQNAVVTAGGGGAIDVALLLVLALIALIKAAGPRRAMFIVPVTIVALGALFSSPVRAADDGWLNNLYGGARLGGSSSSMTASTLTAGLQADGYRVSAADAERSSLSGTLYVGYELPRNFGVELGWSYLGRTRAVLEGVVPPNLNQLLTDAAHIVRGAGDIVTLEGRYRWVLAPHIAVDLRAGPYLWITRTDVSVGGIDEVSRTDDGPGFTVGAGPRLALGTHWGLGVGADYFMSTSQNHFVRVSATLEYHF
jgi:OmpA-like transmembrane domain